MDQLKFVVLDEEDLEVASTHLQDAVGKVADVHWRPQGKARGAGAQPLRLGRCPVRRARIPPAADGAALRARAVMQMSRREPGRPGYRAQPAGGRISGDRVGRRSSETCAPPGAQWVVIDNNPDHRASPPRRPGRRSSRATPPTIDVLLRGRDRPRYGAIIACVDSDAENIFITLTTRGRRSDILIIARASAEDSEKKLLRAGPTG